MYFNLWIYLNYKKNIEIVIQLQDTNYFLEGNKIQIQNTWNVFQIYNSITCISVTLHHRLQVFLFNVRNFHLKRLCNLYYDFCYAGSWTNPATLSYCTASEDICGYNSGRSGPKYRVCPVLSSVTSLSTSNLCPIKTYMLIDLKRKLLPNQSEMISAHVWNKIHHLP